MIRWQQEKGSAGSGFVRRPVRLRVAHAPRLGHYIGTMLRQTYFVQIMILLIVLWLLFAAGLYFTEKDATNASIRSYSDALYWGVAALSTAGIADKPQTGLALAIGGAWIIVGSIIFFGTIVASITGYFMRPVLRPARQIIDTIEYNLEHLDDLSVEELELLKKTTDGLIAHVERIKIQARTELRP